MFIRCGRQADMGCVGNVIGRKIAVYGETITVP